MENSTAPAIDESQENGGAAQQIDPYKLVEGPSPSGGNAVLGFEKGTGFEPITNFIIDVCGYVGDGGHVLCYVLSLDLAVSDPLDTRSHIEEK